MLNKKKVRKEIMNELSSLPDEELFLLEPYIELLEATVSSTIKNTNHDFDGVVNDMTIPTACTNGETVMINLFSNLVKKQPTRVERYLTHIGLVFHEAGHIVYTNFNRLNPLRHEFAKGNVKCDKQVEINDICKRFPNFKKIYTSAINDMVNVVEDGYIENCLCEEFSGVYVKGLDVVNEAIFKESLSFPKIEEMIKNEQTVIPLVLNNFALFMAKDKNFDCSEVGDVEIHKQLIEAIERIKPLVKSLSHFLPWPQKEKKLNALAEIYYDYMPLFPNNPPEGSGKKGSDQDSQNSEGSSEGSSEGQQESKESKEGGKIPDLFGPKEEDGTSSGKIIEVTDIPENVIGSGKMPKSAKGEEVNDAKANKTIEQKSWNQLSKDLQNQLAEAIQQKVQQKEERKQMEETAKVLNASIENDSRLKIEKRYKKLKNTHRYQETLKEIKDVSKACQRKIRQILAKQQTEEENETGFIMGQHFNAKDVFRNDGKYFSKITDGEKPDVVFELLVDESGSMYNGKDEAAAKAAVLFYDIAKGLDIPCRVAGQYEYGNVIIDDICPFNPDQKDIESIAYPKSDGGNDDGPAIAYMCEEILARPEKEKFLIIISDGEPISSCFPETQSGTFRGVHYNPVLDDKICRDAVKECSAIVRYYRKKGVHIIGVCVDQMERIKDIYEITLDCTNLEKLPRTISNIFKKALIK